MGDPHDCKQEEVIAAISGDLGDVSKDIKILCVTNKEVATNMKDMTEVLTQHMLENREHSVEIAHLAKNQDVLFDRLRRLEDIKVPQNEKVSTENRARLIAGEKEIKDVKLSLKEAKTARKTLHGEIDKLSNWKNKIAGGLVIVSLIWTALIMWFFRKNGG